MTWILYHQGSFGPYFPDGNFTDREAKFEAEFERVATDAEKENYGGAFHAFKSANLVPFTRPTEPAKPFQQVSHFQLNRPQKDIADVLQVTNRMNVVSAPVMKIIQKYEPDAVQFWPIDIVTKRGQPASEKSFFAMLVMKSRDAFRPDASTEESCRESFAGSNQWHVEGYKKSFLTGLALETKKIDGAHIWFEERVITNVLFCSPDLGAELSGGGFKLPPKFVQCISV